MSQPQARFSILPLFQLAIRQSIANHRSTFRAAGDVSWGDVAETLGVSVEQVHRWLRSGNLPLAAADRCALRLGLHPVLVWGEEWEVEVEDDEGSDDGSRVA